jgi:hypothetical protein
LESPPLVFAECSQHAEIPDTAGILKVKELIKRTSSGPEAMRMFVETECDSDF